MRLTLAREWSLALAVAAVLVPLVYLTPPSVFDAMDFARFHEPMRAFTVAALRQGRLPLWNPHVNLGRPHFADLQSAVLYPTSWIYVLLPLRAAFAVVATLHLTMGLWALSRLCRRLGAPAALAWPVATVVLFGGAVSSTLQTGSIECTEATCYLPVLLLLALRLAEAPSARLVAGIAVVLALQLLCGHPQYSWLSALGMALFLAGRRLTWPPRELEARALLRDQALLLAAGVGALALDAFQLLPFLELVSQGNRSGGSVAFSSAWSMPWVDWSSLVRRVGPGFAINWVDNLYSGVALVVAGAAGLSAVRDREVRGLALMALVALLIAAGQRTPLFFVLYHLVPGLSAFRLHARCALLVVLALGLAAGRLLAGPVRRPPLVTAAALAITAVIALEAMVPPAQRSWSAAAVQVALIAAATTLLIFSSSRRWSLALLALLSAADVTLATRRMKLAYQARSQFPLEAQIQGTLRQRGLLSPGLPPPRISVPYPYAREDGGMILGHSTFTGYVSLTLDRVWTSLHQELGLTPPLGLNTLPSNEIYQRGAFPYRSMNLVLGLDVHGRRAVLEPRPDPRAYLALAARPVGDWHEAVRAIRDGHDFHATALVEEPVPGLPESAPGGPCAATVTDFQPERIAVQTSCSRPGLLVLAEAWYPGWSAATDGGADVPCLPANGWMRAAAAPAGEHQVIFSYRSRPLPAGAAISGLALAALALLARRRS